jgi:hypothetical protein
MDVGHESDRLAAAENRWLKRTRTIEATVRGVLNVAVLSIGDEKKMRREKMG